MAQFTLITDTVPANEREQKRQARSLAVIAGYLDGYGLLVLGVFVSFMATMPRWPGSRQDEEISLLRLLPLLRCLLPATERNRSTRKSFSSLHARLFLNG